MAMAASYSIEVSAVTQYLADQSDETAGRYVFAYTITMRNTGSVAAQLISRHWIITDAKGLVQEVRGLGVVGAQPLLQPPERCPRCPDPTARPAPESAVYLEYAFDALPGWPSAGLERSLRAFLTGCPRPGALARVCALAAAVAPDDAQAARLFFETNFVPHALVSSA